ncbi:MAG: ABC transporter substrate-binding protein [Proteobacteria bacterium]|nr:ABC transporter substrate-binding protein [Pseudomonadota bacterium]
MRIRTLLGTALIAGLTMTSTARAELSELRVAQQYGISYLPLMIMEDQKLIEKQAKAMGAGDVKVNWSKFAGGNVMNEALLSGSLHFASGGVGPMVTLWARTKGNYDVKAVSAMNSMPLFLTTNNPNVKTLKDFTDKDKIALPAVKVSIQAVTLQMAAEQAFGEGQQNRLDKLTVTMSHPDGMVALLSGASEITGHFTSPPFQYQELEKPGIRTVVSSYDVLGGPATFNLVWTTTKFRAENPKLYDAFYKAFAESIDMINKDKKWAAETYLRLAKDKSSVQQIVQMLEDPQMVFTTTPNNVMKYVNFMHKVGSIKVMPDSWKDMFFPNIHDQPGS